MKVTIVTPALNAAATIERAMASVLSQDADLEYVVVDGGSEDGTMAIVERHAGRLARVVSEKDEGSYHAVEKGFAGSTGEVMGWLGADDELIPGALAFVAEVFETFPQVEWLTSMTPVVSESGRRVPRLLPGFSREAMLDGSYAPGGHPFHLGAVQQESTFWRRGLWDRAGGFLNRRWRLAADFELWVRFWRHASLYGTNVMLGAFGLRPGQISATLPREYNAECIQILENERRASGWAPSGFSASGMKNYVGDYVVHATDRPLEIFRQPFFLLDPEGPQQSLKTAVRRHVIW